MQEEAICRPNGSGMKLLGFWSGEGVLGFSSVSETNSTTGRSFWCRVRRSRNKAEGMRAVGRNLRSEMRESQCLDTDLNWQRDLKGKNEKIRIKTSVLAATASAGGGGWGGWRSCGRRSSSFWWNPLCIGRVRQFAL